MRSWASRKVTLTTPAFDDLLLLLRLELDGRLRVDNVVRSVSQRNGETARKIAASLDPVGESVCKYKQRTCTGTENNGGR